MSKRFRESEDRGQYNCGNSTNDSAKRYRENREMEQYNIQSGGYGYDPDIQYNTDAGGYGGANFYRERSELNSDPDIQHNTDAGGYGGANFYRERSELSSDPDIQHNTHGGDNIGLKNDSNFQCNTYGYGYDPDVPYNIPTGGYGATKFYRESDELNSDSDYQYNTHAGAYGYGYDPNVPYNIPAGGYGASKFHRESSDTDSQYNTHGGGDTFGPANFYIENNELKCDSDFQRNSHDGPSIHLENSEMTHDFQHNIDGSGAVSTSEDGHMKIITGQKLGSYEILDILGVGGFGQVLRVRNTESGRLEALKVAKNQPQHIAAAESELAALHTISSSDTKKQSGCLQMNTWFFANSHLCIAFPYLGGSLFNFMANNNFQPYPVQQVAHITYQLCSAVQFLHLHGMVHMDIKPENVLLVSSSYTIVGTKIVNGQIVDVKELDRTDIRLIDFGGVQREGKKHKILITTAPYRPPEIILDLGWSYACDTWSIACTVFELHCAKILFEGESELELLGIMEARLGQIPMSMASKTSTNFFINGTQNLNWQLGDEDAVRHHLPLEQIMSLKSIDDEELFHLLQEMLKFEPTERISLENALLHPFFGMLLEHQREVNNSGIY